MNVLDKLFSKTPSAKDIRLQLKELERDQIRKRRDLEMIEQTKHEQVKQAILAKKAGKQELLRDLYREMKQGEIDNGYVNNDLRRISLAKTALTTFLRRVEMLEKSKDRKSTQNLIARIQKSSIQRAIDAADVDDDTFNDMLQEIMGEEEISATQGKAKEDVGFAAFDRAIGEMARVEETGAGEEVLSKFRDEVSKIAAKAPDNYPSYGDKVAAKGPDNYPSYGDKVAGVKGLDREPLKSAFPGIKEAEGPKPSPTPPPDPCQDGCVGGSATYGKIHG
jgi:hypothetical protein